jgi:hypothetical protein
MHRNRVSYYLAIASIFLSISAAYLLTTYLFTHDDTQTGPPLPSVIVVRDGETEDLQADLRILAAIGYTSNGVGGGIRGPLVVVELRWWLLLWRELRNGADDD